MKRPPFADLHNLSEDERIKIIGHQAIDHGRVVGFIVEDKIKAKRYIDKLKTAYLDIQVLYQGKIAGGILVKVGPKEKVN